MRGSVAREIGGTHHTISEPPVSIAGVSRSGGTGILACARLAQARMLVPPNRRGFGMSLVSAAAPHPEETIVALSSAPGPGQRAIVRISGPQARRIVDAVFS